MPAATADTPAVALSFANNFWGKEDAGVGPLLDRMQGAKQTCDELKSFYGARASIEDEYARKLLSLCRKSLGTHETGSLKTSLDTVRGEVESMAKQHQNIAAQMKTELEEPLAAFAGGMKERRKIVQNSVEKLLKTKVQQTQHVNKTRDKFEQECLKIKGYLAQGHMVMGQEERRNKAKLEKTQITLATANTEYENAVKALEDTTARWNREWKSAADKFQDLEEERLDFTKSSLWTFANIASTVCVSDDSSCEKIRLSLEKLEVEKDIVGFITDRGTGQEIPDPPKYINFCRGDVNDSQSEVSEDDNYSVAQFPRSINPAFRSSSPQPSTFESHHDPNSALANNLAHREPGQSTSREATVTPQKATSQQPLRMSMDDQYHAQQPPAPMQYDAAQHGPLAAVPHDPYPMDASARPSSRESHSDYSNPTSFSSHDPLSGKTSPVKQEQTPASSPEKRVLKKKSGFFQSHSPFRRKSTKEPHAPAQITSNMRYGGGHQKNFQAERTASPEPIDANASLALGVGQNVLPITTADAQRRPGKASASEVDENDPIAVALAELKGVNLGKQSSVRMSADHYHGIATPAPGTERAARAVPGLGGHDAAAVSRGTPPPSYQQPSQVSRLGVPPPAVTSKAMKQASKKVAEQTRTIFGNAGGQTLEAVEHRQAPGRPYMNESRGSGYRSASPNPYGGHHRQASQASMSQGRRDDHGYYGSASPSGSARGASPSAYRDYNRPQSSYGGGGDMAVQLAPTSDDPYGSQRSRGSARSDSRAMGLYDGGASRPRSKSVADPARQYSRDGRPILHFARALYMYQAAIPEELGFAKGDYLAVFRHQDDGWWEAEVHGGHGRDAIEETVRVVTSKPVQRAVVNTALLVSGAAALLFLASLATGIFFQNFVPDRFVATPVYLQYGIGRNPYGIAPLPRPVLKAQQEYDISVALSMPRSAANIERGNFMVSLHLLASEANEKLEAGSRAFAHVHPKIGDHGVTFSSRRPALLPYVDPIVSVASRIVLLLYHMLFTGSQTCTMTVPLAERLAFPRDAAIPASAYVEVEAGQDIQIYSTTLTMTAQLRGLRWLMFHYRLATYVAFTLLFWVCEVLFMALAWGAWSAVTVSEKPGKGQQYQDDDEDSAGSEPPQLSDYPHTFPTYGSQPPLKHEPGVKQEDIERHTPRMSDIPVAGAEADDEDDDDERDDGDSRSRSRYDSGIGTSYDSERRSVVRKRSSRGRLEG
ncbi:hypothetical protein O9K51_05570 [Purpureocillium lavendulum]|uniref:F-BAR domain-containing protein n=1 Tax=Purpureocillium lavendulum TaxID=1247861 RepID=A0AB34FSD8_9HYPO|nr:hypothetical protein O9K51_05570 [Purpureocillium lavendulum]